MCSSLINTVDILISLHKMLFFLIILPSTFVNNDYIGASLYLEFLLSVAICSSVPECRSYPVEHKNLPHDSKPLHVQEQMEGVHGEGVHGEGVYGEYEVAGTVLEERL